MEYIIRRAVLFAMVPNVENIPVNGMVERNLHHHVGIDDASRHVRISAQNSYQIMIG
jgi:hypothetical protein